MFPFLLETKQEIKKGPHISWHVAKGMLLVTVGEDEEGGRITGNAAQPTWWQTKLNSKVRTWSQRTNSAVACFCFSCLVYDTYTEEGVGRWAERRGRQSNGWGTIGGWRTKGRWGGGSFTGTLMKGVGVAQRKHSNGNQQVLNFSFVCMVLCLFSLYIWSSPSLMS